mmetsp:Transcript_7792/g.13833  ORF Transcript_7792/g.13833 Transcript_7792/m.13833 type:complete len:221 (-) Transcript_7792:123-785(-)|eukprot:CAMPEP_0197664412 /NCGR_PEP_ID=MMETSP1338-20131121/58617_1 /TAXON_ID=43686 ORGANISM="Pelagodinium beii, Strain RCC1491" /NCGR_SAMPLE_ID=MMETSP1338 /ASSEMBLY_ACC=CAM_ASM_000754 /LENGTH=220 /DNA_ID=CAMNT_0043243039 /DNA_START=54 /DNA_END=716 /DNA_ORIENTATION=-
MAVNTEEIEQCRDVLRACRSSQGEKDLDKVIDALKRLATLHVDAASLRSTGIGKEVNDRFFRTHQNTQVSSRSASLIHSWKAMALGGKPSEEGAETRESPAKEITSKKPASEPPPSPEPKAKRAKTTEGAVADGPNEELATLFNELAGFEFKKGGNSKFAGVTFKKVAVILRELNEKVVSGTQIAHLKGIGKETVKKIDQYIETGTMEKLEKYRKGDFDD